VARDLKQVPDAPTCSNGWVCTAWRSPSPATCTLASRWSSRPPGAAFDSTRPLQFVSGVTLYQVTEGRVDEGTFVALDDAAGPDP
jgi:hypothetical protein